MNVPMFDLKPQYATIRDEITRAVCAVLDTQDCCNGSAVREFEKEIAAYCRCAAAVGVSNGTDALLCSLMALGVGEGDEVIVPTFTFFATAGCVWRVGAKPVFVDIEPDTFNIDPAKIEAALTEKTKAIIPVHLYGQMADMDAIMKIAGRRGISVIEDAAQAIGASQHGRVAGTVGTVGCLSFYPSKNLGGVGDCGMILTDDSELAERLAIFRTHGESSRYHYKYVGGNFRMASIQAAALSVKLGYLDQWVGKRAAIAARYDELLAGTGGIVRPVVRDCNVSVHYVYVIRTPGRDQLQAFLKENDIGTSIYYPLCLHEQECFASLGHRRGEFPVSERAAGEVLALPMFPELADEQIVYVAETIKGFLS